MFLKPGPTARGILKRLKKCAVPTVPVYDPELRPFVPPKFYKGPVEEEGAPPPSASTLPYTIPPVTLTSPFIARTEEFTDLSQVHSEQPSTDLGENHEPSPKPASLPDGCYDHACSTSVSLSDGYYDHAYSKKFHEGLEQNDDSPNWRQKPKPPPKRRGRPPLYKKVQPFVCVDSQPSDEEVGSPPDLSQLEQLSSHSSDSGSEEGITFYGSPQGFTDQEDLSRTREKIASEAAKVKNKQASCSVSLSPESRGDYRQVRNSTSFGPKSLDDPQIFLSSLDGTNASTQVSCWQVSVPTAQNRAKVARRNAT
ncbi:hypothetical protein MTO96_027866 [Rhipicephalus appendiculatus]